MPTTDIRWIQTILSKCTILLPFDVAELISHHFAARIVQFRFRRWRLYSHARGKDWASVRKHLGADAVRALWPYSLVRREWRTEPSSWTYQDDAIIKTLVGEMHKGYWGTKCDMGEVK